MFVVSNAAGTCKTASEVADFARYGVTSVNVGSITLEQRLGNPGENLFIGDGYSVNSLGLPNPGLDYYLTHLPKMWEDCKSNEKDLTLSIAGFNSDEFISMMERIPPEYVDLIELNLGCPNVSAEGQRRRILCYDPDLMWDVLNGVGLDIPLSVKLSPIFDPILMDEIAHVLNSALVQSVVAINTIPNVYEGSINMKLGGYGGKAVLPIGLGQVRQWRSLLKPEIGIIGVGGVGGVVDARKYQALGAYGVQINTAFLEQGDKVFYKVLSGMNSGEGLSQV